MRTVNPAGPIRGVWTVYVMEVRSLARDRQALIYSIVLPIFLYPVLLLATVQAITYARGVKERRDVRVAGVGLGADERFRSFLAEREGVDLVPPDAQKSAAELIEAREADAVLSVEAAAAGAGELRLHTFYSSARDISVEARDRIATAADEFRDLRLEEAATSLGEDGTFLDVLSIEDADLTTSEELASYVAGLILPLLMIVMIAMGALYPALESTVGEKERKTLETTLVSPAPRSALVVGKYLAVVTFSLAAFTLNFASMGLTLSHLNLQFQLASFSLGLLPIVTIFAGAFLLAAFLSGIMMVLAFLAKSYKEGQTYTMPVYLVAVMSSVVISDPEATLTPAVAWVPLINIVLLFRGALTGGLTLLPAAATFFSSLLYTAAALGLAARLLGRESVATGAEVRLRDALAFLWRREDSMGGSHGKR